jgi:hypothetical protein
MPPALTVRAFAEMLELPLYEQLRILEEQKYPERAPASFRVPYYRSALNAIMKCVREAGTGAPRCITDIRNSTMQAARIENNIRVIRSFERSRQPGRQLNSTPSPRMTSTLSGVELRYTTDLSATEGQQQKYILFNCRQAPITIKLAKTTLELVHWLLTENGVNAALVWSILISLPVAKFIRFAASEGIRFSELKKMLEQ